MRAFQLFLSVDLSLGRVDYSLFSDQTLMEMFIDGFDDKSKKRYQDDEGIYLDVCEWTRIKCDEEKSVVEIAMDCHSIRGSLALLYVPPKVNGISNNSFTRGELNGSVDLTHLPDRMEFFDLHNNQLTGEIDLTRLPDSMEENIDNFGNTDNTNHKSTTEEFYGFYMKGVPRLSRRLKSHWTF